MRTLSTATCASCGGRETKRVGTDNSDGVWRCARCGYETRVRTIVLKPIDTGKRAK